MTFYRGATLNFYNTRSERCKYTLTHARNGDNLKKNTMSSPGVNTALL